MHSVGPNNFPFYSESERYQPVIQADGGQLSGECSLRKWCCIPSCFGHDLDLLITCHVGTHLDCLATLTSSSCRMAEYVHSQQRAG